MRRLISAKLLLNPLVIAGSIILAVIIGQYDPSLAVALKPFGNIFLDLLKVCVIPLIITAIPSGFARILLHKIETKIIWRMILVFLGLFLLFTLSGLILAKALHLGDLSEAARNQLGTILLDVPHASTIGASIAQQHQGIADFLSHLVTGNIFDAFEKGNILSVLIFAILLGLSLGYACTQLGELSINVFQGLFETFLKLINGVIHLLPFGIVCLISSQIAETGFGTVSALGALIGSYYIFGGIVIFLTFLVLSYYLKTPWYKLIYQFRQMIIVAFISQSSYAAFPFGVQVLEKKHGLEPTRVNLFYPITVALNPVGGAAFFAMITIFAANLYSVPLHYSDYLVVMLGSAFVSIALGGIPAVAGFTTLSIIFSSLQIPLVPIVIMLIAINNIIDPLMTLINSCINATEVAYLTNQSNRRET